MWSGRSKYHARKTTVDGITFDSRKEADTKSRRPGFTGAAKPDLAAALYERFMEACRAQGFPVEHGEFGADMQVESVNDGPVTILFDTAQPF